MQDIMNMKLKKKIKFKELPKNNLKIQKLKTSLPTNNKTMNLMKITNGIPISKSMNNFIKPRFKDAKISSKQDKIGMYSLGTMKLPKNKDFPIQTAGRTRIKQQKGLKPWGDFDGDKVINMLDCNPRNKRLQGPEHTIEDKMNPSDELRRDYSVENVESPEISISTSDVMKQPEQKQAIVDPEIEQRKKKIESLEIQEKQKRLALLRRQEQEKELELKRRRKELAEIEKKKKATTRVSIAKKVAQPITGAFSTISGASRSLGGFGVSQQGIRGATASKPSQYKLLLALGKISPQEAQAMQPQPEQIGTIQEAQASTEVGVKSPYSGRKVSYVRGPYKKSRQ